MTNYKSSCCNAEVKSSCSEDLGAIGTCYYICTSCNKPCDPVKESKFVVGWREANKNHKLKKPQPSRFWWFVLGMILMGVFGLIVFNSLLNNYIMIDMDYFNDNLCWCKSDLKSFLDGRI